MTGALTAPEDLLLRISAVCQVRKLSLIFLSRFPYATEKYSTKYSYILKHRTQQMPLTTKNMKLLVGPHIDTTIWGKRYCFLVN